MRQIVRADQPAITSRPSRSSVMPLAWLDGWTRISFPMPGVHCQIVSPMMSVNMSRWRRWSQTGPSPNVMPLTTWSSGGAKPTMSLKAGSFRSMSKGCVLVLHVEPTEFLHPLAGIHFRGVDVALSIHGDVVERGELADLAAGSAEAREHVLGGTIDDPHLAVHPVDHVDERLVLVGREYQVID